MALSDQTLGDFLASLGDKTPTPGGGAVAGVGTAIAASLAQMVVRFAIGKAKFAAHESANAAALEALETAMAEALAAADADEKAYARLNRLWKLATTDPEREAEWPGAVHDAIAAPMRMLETAAAVLRGVRGLLGTTSATLVSDLAIAADFALAGARSAAWNIRINLPLLPEASDQPAIESRMQALLGEAADLAGAVERHTRQALKSA